MDLSVNQFINQTSQVECKTVYNIHSKNNSPVVPYELQETSQRMNNLLILCF